jgi:site-specific DNA-methyltransferase (adenine-specific)
MLTQPELAVPRPYYDEDGITIYLGDCRDVLPYIGGARLMLTDPPYDDRTAKNARGAGGHCDGRGFIDRAIGSIDLEDLRALFTLAAASMAPPAWCVATVAWQHAARLEVSPPEGWQFTRCGVWVKPDGAPQFSGDRPAQGWEAVAILHTTAGGRMSWNGGGSRAVWTHCITRDVKGHPTVKPLALVRDWVTLFSDPGDLVLDPFMGSGTTLRAAKDLGRRAIGIEVNERYCDLAVRRLRQQVLFF